MTYRATPATDGAEPGGLPWRENAESIELTWTLAEFHSGNGASRCKIIVTFDSEGDRRRPRIICRYLVGKEPRVEFTAVAQESHVDGRKARTL
jgi:hypothetical protein